MLPARHFLCVKEGKTSFFRVAFAVLREETAADSCTKQRITPHNHSGCHSIAPGLSRAKSSFSHHPKQGNQPLPMWNARDGGSDTDIPGITQKKLSVGCNHCEKDRHFFFFLHQLFIMINAKS